MGANTLSGGSNSAQESSFSYNSSSRTLEKCNCGIEAVEKTVRKEGNNCGKQFFACSKAQDDSTRCNFFMVTLIDSHSLVEGWHKKRSATATYIDE